MNILFFDTETTGMVSFKLGLEHPAQPHLVQLAALLTDETGHERASMDVIVKPDGWAIPKAAADIHGITTEIATEKGMALSEAAGRFLQMAREADLFVAHNIDFDRIVMSAAFHRLKMINPFGGKDLFCTMKAATPICKILGPYGFKWPKLTEAYRHFFGKDFEGAHDALADVRACKDVYFAMQPTVRTNYVPPKPALEDWSETYPAPAKVQQTLLGEGEGNCFQASVASLFNLPLDKVPHFCKEYDDANWFPAFREWCFNLNGFWPLMVDAKCWKHDRSIAMGFVLISGKSPRGIQHSVLGYANNNGLGLIHDPYPDGGCLVSVDDVIVFCQPIQTTIPVGVSNG